MVRPSQRREMAKQAVADKNAVIADWLLRLTWAQKNRGVGLCFLHLRNVKYFPWNHKRVYRIYRELELNLRIKPKKRIVREKPQPLAVPATINQVWSMDFSLPAERVIRSLEQISAWRGKPAVLRCDNGPEYITTQTEGGSIAVGNPGSVLRGNQQAEQPRSRRIQKKVDSAPGIPGEP